MNEQFILSVELRKEKIPDRNAWPFSIPAIRRLGKLRLDRGITIFIGENGSGKSTLLEAIAVGMGLNPEGGSKNFNFSTSATHSDLHRSLKIVKGVLRPKDFFFLRAESFYNVATEVERLGVTDSYGGMSLHEQSHGESFMTLLTNRFRGNGLYLLDEPEAALSPQRQLSCLRVIHDLIQKGSQFIISTHSPILMGYPEALIYQLSEKGIARVNYEETEHYQVTRLFIEQREAVLRELLRED